METLLTTINNLKTGIYGISWIMITVTLVLVLMIFWKLFMSQNFALSAPLITQRSPEVLGIGQNIRFAQQYTSTNQDTDSQMAKLLGSKKENLLSHSENPVYYEVPKVLDTYQNSASTIADEGFKVAAPGSLTMEAFAGPEEHLREVLYNQK